MKAKMNKVQNLNKELIHALNDQAKQLQLEQRQHGELKAAHRLSNVEKEEVCAQMASLQTSMKAQQRQLSQLCLFQEQMTKQLKAAKAEAATTRCEADATRHKLSADIDELTQQRDELEAHVSDLRQANQAANDEVSELKSTLTTQEHAAKEVRDELKHTQSEREAMRIEKDKMHDMVQQQHEREVRLVSALEEVAEKLRVSQAEKEKLEMATKKELAEVSLLKMQCDELEHLLQQKNVERRGVHRGLDRLKVSLRSAPCRIHENPMSSKPAPRSHQLNVKVKAQSIESLREDHEDECTVHCKPKLPNNMKQQLEELENEMALQQHQIALLEDQRIRLEEEKTVDVLQ